MKNRYLCRMNEKKPLFVSDMDGTLLGSDSLVSPESVQMLNQAIAAGALFTVATARTPATVVPLMSQVNANLPFICLNGAALWDNQRGDYTIVNVLPTETVSAIARVYERHGLHPFVYRRHGHIIHAHHYGALSKQEAQFVAERKGLALKKFMLGDPGYSQSRDDAMLIFSMQDYVRLKPIYEEIKATISCSAVLYHDIFDNASGILEIYAPGVSKAAAVKRLKQMTGSDCLIVFGDNRNDILMMQVADYSVAVGNAFPEVKAAASQVIQPNVTHAVGRYILAHTSQHNK